MIQAKCLLGLGREPVLVLTRKPAQSIVASCEEAEVRFTIIRHNVGVEAPPYVKIMRAELLDEEPAA
jgi:sRNA-binding carbon storage regulator CsrA